MGWIYVFQDAGYERGAKVGRCGSRNGMHAWNAAPCYSPREMLYVAGWEVVTPIICRTASRALSGMSEVETHLHGVCAPALTFPRNGREWFNLTPRDAIERLSDEFSRKPTGTNRHIGVTVTNDQFRNPAPARLGQYDHKVAAWIYQEHLTGKLKTQLIDDWKAPKEIRRRYSRNGFAEEMAFSYHGPVDGTQSLRLLEAWKEIMRHLGPGPNDGAYGWLNDGVEISEVAALYRKHGFAPLDVTSSTPPQGVRQDYHEPVSRSEKRGTGRQSHATSLKRVRTAVAKRDRRLLHLVGWMLLLLGAWLAFQPGSGPTAVLLLLLGFFLSPLRRRRR